MEDDSRLRDLVALAKRAPHQESARRDVASFSEFEERLVQRAARPRARSRSVRRFGLGLSALALVAAAYVSFEPKESNEPPLQFAVTTAPDVGHSGSAQRLSFSDGSEIQVAPQAELRVAQVTPQGARMVLARGSAEVAIARRKHAAWQFQAGPYTVKVTGTAFRLRWSEERQELEVGMRHGSVIVSGPLSPLGVSLRAGQRLIASERTHRLVVEDLAQPGAESARAAAEAPAPAEPLARASARPKAPAREAPSAAHDWSKLVAQGEFQRVLREAKAVGLPRTLASAGAEDLTALADAARYARETKLARAALMSLRERFPDSQMGSEAAFFLGRLSSGAAALLWYDRYLQEQPQGQYASQALGRSMMLHYERGDSARAAEQASSYLARFPAGPYAASARTLREPARVLPPGP